MRYTFKDLVKLVHVNKRAEFTRVYEYLHKIENPQENEEADEVAIRMVDIRCEHLRARGSPAASRCSNRRC